MIESKESKTRDIPVWLTGLVLLLCIGGGGWLIMWYLRDNPHQVVTIPEDKTAGAATFGNKGAWRNQFTGGGNPNVGGQRPPRINPDADGIQPLGKNSFRAKVGNTIVNVNASGANRYDFVPRYLNAQTPEQFELGMMRLNVLSDSNWREQLKLTDEQLAKLRQAAAPGMQLDAADRTRLADLWKAYHEGPPAGKPAAEKNFLAAVDEIGKKNVATFKQNEAARAEAIKSALTPEQLKLYRDAGGAKPPAAKPKPAVAPPAPAAPVSVKG